MAPVYEEMLVGARAADIVHTPAISGVPASFLRPSMVAAGIEPDDLGLAKPFEHEAKASRDVWSAGHGVGAIEDRPTVGELCRRSIGALRAAAADPFAREEERA